MGSNRGRWRYCKSCIVLGGMFYRQLENLRWLALAPVPFLAGGALWYTLTAHRRYRLQRRAASAMNSLLHDNLSGIRQIKSFVREGEEHARFNKASDALRRATLVVMKVWAIYNPSMYLFGSLGVLAGRRGRNAWRFYRARCSSADLIAFLMLSGFLYEPVGKLHQLNQLMQAGRAAGERVFEIIDEPAESQRGRKFERAVRGEIEFRDVSFSYGTELPALSDVSFHVAPGRNYCVGRQNRCGKIYSDQFADAFL